MAWTNYKPTAAERRAIEQGWSVLLSHCRSEFEAEKLLRQERKGYGSRTDSIPAIAAKALIAKWFLEGVEEPDMLLRDTYYCRPAALWALGHGASRVACKLVSTNNITDLGASRRAHDDTFARMTKVDLETIAAAARTRCDMIVRVLPGPQLNHLGVIAAQQAQWFGEPAAHVEAFYTERL